ncbi:MAG: hypothetical protein ABSB23_22610 [Bryobacteraceae bacterium]|jgi:hypothetical protein
MSHKDHLSALADSAGELADLHQRLGKALRKHVGHLRALANGEPGSESKADVVNEFFKFYQQPGAATRISGADELFR